MAGYPENSTYHISTEEIIDICKRQGLAFEASREVTLAQSATAYSIFKTGSKPVILFSRAFGYNGVGINVFMNRDPAYSNIGTLDDTIRNPNDINPQAKTVSLYSAPTLTNNGTETRMPIRLFSGSNPSQFGQPIQTIGTPQLILPNKELLLFFTSRSSNTAQQVTAALEWCEPTRIPGIVLNSDGTFNRYNGKLL